MFFKVLITFLIMECKFTEKTSHFFINSVEKKSSFLKKLDIPSHVKQFDRCDT